MKSFGSGVSGLLVRAADDRTFSDGIESNSKILFVEYLLNKMK